MLDLEKYNEIKSVLTKTFILNLIIALIKIGYGLWFKLISMIADGFHSLLDSSSNIVGFIGIRMAVKPPDAIHPYGHRKFETFASLGISLLLFLACYRIAEDAFQRLRNPVQPEAGLMGFIIIIISLILNFFVARYEFKKGHQLKSQVLVADSAHTKSDFYASAIVLLSLIFIRLGFPFLDILSALFIAILIFKAALGILSEGFSVLADTSQVKYEEIERIASQVQGVFACHKIRTRGLADDIHVDLHILVEPEMDTTKAHDVVHEVERKILENVQGVTDVIIHTEPYNPS